MKRRVAQDQAQVGGGRVDAIAADHFTFQAVGGQRQATGSHGEGVDVQQGQPALRIAAFHRGTQHAGTATEVQYMPAR
ncbi:hypothetical protein D3C76_597340 [compost metagenome]